MTTKLGLNILTKLAIPRPSQDMAVSTTWPAAASPRAAARNTKAASRSCSAASSLRRLLGLAAAAARPSLAMAVAEASVSRQPLLPQAQAGPRGSRIMCPTSPADQPGPRSRRPSVTMPEPMPVPIDRYIKSLQPWARPRDHSPKAAARTSLSIYTGASILRDKSPAMGTSCQPRLQEKRQIPVFKSRRPGTPRPTAFMGWPLAKSRTSLTKSSITVSEPSLARVAILPWRIMAPSKVAAAPWVLVPPRSMPIITVFIIIPSGISILCGGDNSFSNLGVCPRSY